MRAIFHWWYIYLETRLIDGILDWKRGRMGNRPLINLVSRHSWQAVYSQWTKKWRSRPSEDEVAEFQAKTARNKCKNKQNISLDGRYLLFRCICKEKHLVTSWNRAEEYATILRWGRLVKNGEILFEWIIRQLLNSAFVWCEELCRSRRMVSTYNILLDLHNYSHHTQLH